MLAELGLVLIAGTKFGAIYALAALGLVVVHKATKTVNFAHGAFAMLGAFASYLIVVHWQWPYWTAYLCVPILIGIIALSNATLQLGSDPRLRGRVMALFSMALLGPTPIGGPIVGWLGEHVSPRISLLVGGLAALADVCHHFCRFKVN